jgi:GAF domain-containing protein
MPFLAELSRALQPLTDPAEVVSTAARMLGEHLAVDRCAYAEVDADEDHFVLTGDYTRGDTGSIIGRYAMSDFGAEVLRLMHENRPYVVHDVRTDERVTARDLAAYERTQIGAVICVPLHKDGRFRAAMAVHQRAPRAWHAQDVELLEMGIHGPVTEPQRHDPHRRGDRAGAGDQP